MLIKYNSHLLVSYFDFGINWIHPYHEYGTTIENSIIFDEKYILTLSLIFFNKKKYTICFSYNPNYNNLDYKPTGNSWQWITSDINKNFLNDVKKIVNRISAIFYKRNIKPSKGRGMFY